MHWWHSNFSSPEPKARKVSLWYGNGPPTIVAERLALPTSDHGVAGSNPAEGEILPEPKRRFIAQSLLCSPFHRLEMTEILLKGRKTLTHPSIHPSNHRPLASTFFHHNISKSNLANIDQILCVPSLGWEKHSIRF